jgi:hypothetical protein
MLEASQDICKLFNADRLTLYVLNDEQNAIISKVKTGLNSSRDLKLPITPQSIAGYVAFSRMLVNLPDVYDDEALKRIHPALTFLKEVDKRSGYRTRQMLVAPILEGSTLYGVLQVINNKGNQPFGDLEIEGVSQLCKTLATAIRHRTLGAASSLRRIVTKYDGLISDGVMSEPELAQCLHRAREEGLTVERMLHDGYQVKAQQIGPSLARFFGVAYEPLAPGRIRSEALHGALKKEFIEEQGWIPLEESTEGWLSCAWTRRLCAPRASCIRCFRVSASLTIGSPPSPSSRRPWGRSLAWKPVAAALTKCWPTWTVAPLTKAATTIRWSLPPLTMNWSSLSTRSSWTPTTKASDIHIEPMPGKARPASAFASTAPCSPILKCRRISGRPWSRD